MMVFIFAEPGYLVSGCNFIYLQCRQESVSLFSFNWISILPEILNCCIKSNLKNNQINAGPNTNRCTSPAKWFDLGLNILFSTAPKSPLFQSILSHGADLWATFRCALASASTVTITLGGVHSWAGLMCFDCWKSRQGEQSSSGDLRTRWIVEVSIQYPWKTLERLSWAFITTFYFAALEMMCTTNFWSNRAWLVTWCLSLLLTTAFCAALASKQCLLRSRGAVVARQEGY